MMDVERYEREIITTLEKFIQYYIVNMEKEVPASRLGIPRDVLEVMEKLKLIVNVGMDYYRLSSPSLITKILIRKGRINELFPLIEGYNDIKAFIARSFFTRGVNILLEGPPASGKTLFLETIYVLNQDIGLHVDASNTTAAGFLEMVIEESPEIICIDEFDKPYDKKLYNTLSNLLEFGKAIETKYRKTRARSIKANFYVAVNDSSLLPGHILDRFLKFRLRPYTIEEIYRISVNALLKYQIINDEELARLFVETMLKDVGLYSIRDIIKLGKFVGRREDIDFVRKLAKKYIVH